MSSPPSPVAELLADLRDALSPLGVRWYLFGAQAAILHGAARLTADVDVTADLGQQPSAAVVARLGAAGFSLRVPDVEGFVETTRVLPLVHARTRMPVDIVLAGPGLEERFFAGVEERVIGDVRVPVACAEDMIAMKVLAGRPQDLDDVAAIVRARGDGLELARTRETLRLLEQALARRDLLSELERTVTRGRRAGPPGTSGR